MKEDKRDSILIAAEKLFSEHGFEGASTRHIAQEAGVNMAMLNYYFGSKEGLYKAIFENKFKGFQLVLSSIFEEPLSSWEKLHKYIDIYADRIIKQNCFHRLIQHELSVQQRSEMTEFILQHLMVNINVAIKIIEEGIANGSFRKVDVELTVASVLGTKYYVINLAHITSELLGKDLNDPEVITKEIKPRLKAHLKDLLNAHLKPID